MKYTKAIANKIIRGQKRRYAQLIIQISIASIAIGMTVMLLSIGIVTGFQHTIRNKVSGFGAHITISHFDLNQSYEATPILSDQPYLRQLKANANIKAVQPFATKAGIIKKNNEVEGIALKGIDSNYSFDFFKKAMISGSVLGFDSASSKNIMISKVIADRLNYKVGDKVPMYFVQNSKESQTPKARAYKICGIFETGLSQFDSKFALTNIDQIRTLNDWKNGEIYGFEILLNDFSKIDQTAEEVSSLIPYDQKAKTIIESNPETFDWIALFDTNMYILIGLMIIISTITVISTLLILILEQTNTIGILKAIGANNRTISKIFTYVAGNIILKGMLIGNVAALAISFIQKYGKVIKLNQELYYMDAVPVEINLFHYLIINGGVFIATSLFVLIPIIIVTRKISTIQAIRYQ